MSPRPAEAEAEAEAATATTERVEAATAVAAPVAPPPSGAPFIYDLRGHSRGGALCVRVCVCGSIATLATHFWYALRVCSIIK